MQIIIEENDLPITVAEKLVKATRPVKGEMMQKINRAFGGEGETDMFTEDELLEIAEYLKIYCKYASKGRIEADRESEE